MLVPGVHLGILGGGVPPGYPNRHPISAQKCHFSHQFSKLVSKIHTRFQQISITEINYAIRWIVIYPVDSAIQRLNNRGLASRKLCHHFLNWNIRKNDSLIRTFDHTSVSYLLIWNWKDKSTSSRSFAPIVPSKTFTRFQTKMGKVYTRFRPKNSAKNPTLWGGTHLHGLYKGSPLPGKLVK